MCHPNFLSPLGLTIVPWVHPIKSTGSNGYFSSIYATILYSYAVLSSQPESILYKPSHPSFYSNYFKYTPGNDFNALKQRDVSSIISGFWRNLYVNIAF